MSKFYFFKETEKIDLSKHGPKIWAVVKEEEVQIFRFKDDFPHIKENSNEFKGFLKRKRYKGVEPSEVLLRANFGRFMNYRKHTKIALQKLADEIGGILISGIIIKDKDTGKLKVRFVRNNKIINEDDSKTYDIVIKFLTQDEILNIKTD